MHGIVRKDAADHFDMHFWSYNAWQHYTISTETRHKLLRHDYFRYILNILCNLDGTFLLIFKMYSTLLKQWS